jgi:hypothetical protein
VGLLPFAAPVMAVSTFNVGFAVGFFFPTADGGMMPFGRGSSRLFLPGRACRRNQEALWYWPK